jgi:hypothetical protein
MKVKHKILCPITDWEERVIERGRTVGAKIIERKVIGADPWNWFIGTEVKGKENIIPEAYYGNMKILMQDLDIVTKDVPKAGNAIIGKLVEMTNRTPEFVCTNPFGDLAKLGGWIDENFKTSFHKPYPPKVYHEVFGEEANTENETCTA